MFARIYIRCVCDMLHVDALSDCEYIWPLVVCVLERHAKRKHFLEKTYIEAESEVLLRL